MENTTNTTGNLPIGFWQGLWENADEGVDATGNMIVSIIQAAKGEYPYTTIEDDSAKYYAIMVVAISIAVALIFILK